MTQHLHHPATEPLTVQVDWVAADGTETPRALTLGTRRVEVLEVLDRWPGVEHQYFKVSGDDGDTYIVRHDLARGVWELTLFTRGVQRS